MEELCSNCRRRPPKSGRKSCCSCLDKTNKASRKYNAKLRSAGLCIRCGKTPVVYNKWRCEECANKGTRDTRKGAKIWREKNKALGMCQACGKRPPIDGKFACKICSNKKNNSNNLLRKERKENGFCVECGEIRENQLHIRCNACLEYQKNISDNRKKRLRSQELCDTCGKEKHVIGQLSCQICCLKNMSYSLWKTTKKWQEVKKLYDKQNGKCPYTGELIEIGINVSIDHIIPKSKGGTDDLGNLQFIHEWVNTMKWDKTDCEFKSMINKIYLNLNSIKPLVLP